MRWLVSRPEMLTCSAGPRSPAGGWLPLVCTQNCAAVPEEVRRGFGLSRDAITELAAACAAGCGGVNFIPFVTGERTPNWPDASGALLGLTPGCIRPGAPFTTRTAFLAWWLFDCEAAVLLTLLSVVRRASVSGSAGGHLVQPVRRVKTV